MTRTTTDLRRAVEGLGHFENCSKDPANCECASRADVLALIPEGDEPVYLVTASELAAAMNEGWPPDVPLVDDSEVWTAFAEAILSRLGGEE